MPALDRQQPSAFVLDDGARARDDTAGHAVKYRGCHLGAASVEGPARISAITAIPWSSMTLSCDQVTPDKSRLTASTGRPNPASYQRIKDESRSAGRLRGSAGSAPPLPGLRRFTRVA